MSKNRVYRGRASGRLAAFGPLPSYWGEADFLRWTKRRVTASVETARHPSWLRPGPLPAPAVQASSSGIGVAAWAAIICACLIMLLSTGLRSTMGFFAEPTSLSLAISIGTFSFAVAMHQLLWGVFQPFAGIIADRLGPIPALLLGAGAYAGGFVLMATAESGTVLFLGAGVAVGLALACTSFGVMAGAVARLVPPKDRSSMFGIIAAAGAMGQATVVPIVQQSLDVFDWRTVGWGLAVAAGCIALFSVACRRQLQDRPLRPSASAMRLVATASGGLARSVAGCIYWR